MRGIFAVHPAGDECGDELVYHGPSAENKRHAAAISIRKWRNLKRFSIKHQDLIFDAGPTTCGFCHKYYIRVSYEERMRGEDPSCIGCPIYKITGERLCKNTPYDAYSDETDFYGHQDLETGLKAIDCEIDFLRCVAETLKK